MLTIEIVTNTLFDDSTNKFIEEKISLDLEHSLVSLSKWESEFEKPFLGREGLTIEETFRYIQLMILTPNVPQNIFRCFSQKNIDDIQAYISGKQTATTFNEIASRPPTREIITAEIIYYWMNVHNIDMECQYWHLNRLITFIRVCNIKNAPKKKIPRHEQAAQQRALNAQRRAQLGTTG